MKKILPIFLTLFCACVIEHSEPIDPSPIIIMDSDSAAFDLTGVWDWKYSDGYPSRFTPETEGYTVALIVGPGHYVELRKQNAIVYRGPAETRLGRPILTKMSGYETYRYMYEIKVDGETRFECIGIPEGLSFRDLSWERVLPSGCGVFVRR